MKPYFSIKNFDVKWIIVITLISVTWVNFNQERWVSKNVIAHDITNYNSYLPALFYEKDLSLSFLNDTVNREIESKLYSPNRTRQGNPVIKMSMGMAVTYLPFFGLAHIYSKLFNYPANGFSEPYHFALLFSTLFYYIFGIIFLWRVLKHYFSIPVATLTLFSLTFATNVFFYLTIAGALAHTIGFAFVAAFLFYTIKWHQDPKLKTAIIIGFILGFLTLVRPINILVFIFFLLYDIKTANDFSAKIKLLFTQKFQMIILGLCAFLVCLPQLLYWKYVTGSYFFNSYVGEHFYFNNPHVLNALFGFRKGWLIYTPIMLFSLAGFFWLRDNLKPFLFPLVVFLMIYVYVAFSWWCWWYGGSFGQRVMIDVYPLLALPFAAFLTRVEHFKGVNKKVIYFSIAFFVFLNLFQSMQAKYNIIHYDSMTRQNYFEVFFTTTKKPDREKYLKHPDYEKALRGEDED